MPPASNKKRESGKNPSYQRTDTNYSTEQKQISDSGSIAAGDQGNLYQKRWFLYLAILAYQTGEEFILRFEVPGAGAFDDISLEIYNYTYFVQVKHTSTNDKITKGKLNKKIGKGDAFSLSKYYESWCTILKNNSKKNTTNFHCIIMTNYTTEDECSDILIEKLHIAKWKSLLKNTGKYFSIKKMKNSLITSRKSLQS